MIFIYFFQMFLDIFSRMIIYFLFFNKYFFSFFLLLLYIILGVDPF